MKLTQETPADEARDGLTNTPPTSQECERPLLVTRKVLEKDGRIQDQIAASAEPDH